MTSTPRKRKKRMTCLTSRFGYIFNSGIELSLDSFLVYLYPFSSSQARMWGKSYGKPSKPKKKAVDEEEEDDEDEEDEEDEDEVFQIQY